MNNNPVVIRAAIIEDEIPAARLLIICWQNFVRNGRYFCYPEI